MNSLSNLQRVSEYLQALEIFEAGCGWQFVTSQGDATTKLDKLSGIQVLKARPEMRRSSIDQDDAQDTIDTAIFVISKDLAAGKTDEKENIQYNKLLEIADMIVGKMKDDTTISGCQLLSGLTISSLQIVPESMMFGSWCGWSIDISFTR